MNPEIRMALDGLQALIELEASRLHLKIRRYDQITMARVKALEKAVAALQPPPDTGGTAGS